MRHWLALAPMGLLLLPQPSRASKVEVARAELCAVAEKVVLAEVTGQEVVWAEGSRGMVYTVADVSVLRTLRGEPAEDLRVYTRGGALQGLVQQVEDAAVLQVDRRYLLLLAPRHQGGWRVVGGEDGAVLLPWDVDPSDTLDTLGGCLAR